MPDRPSFEFWYEFASTYSYLTAIRIGALASEAGVELLWRPFLLGPIFQAQGWETSPFNIYPAKGRYMVRDIERIAAERGRTFKMPAVFPANGLAAARIALVGDEPGEGWVGEFTRHVYEAQFERQADIANEAILAEILTLMGRSAPALIARSRSSANKERLRLQSARAVELGIFGAPSFITQDGELFWGDDRLEQALAWAKAAGGR